MPGNFLVSAPKYNKYVHIVYVAGYVGYIDKIKWKF